MLGEFCELISLIPILVERAERYIFAPIFKVYFIFIVSGVSKCIFIFLGHYYEELFASRDMAASETQLE